MLLSSSDVLHFTLLDKRKCFVVHKCLLHKKRFLLHCSLLHKALPNCLGQCKPRKGKITLSGIHSTLEWYSFDTIKVAMFVTVPFMLGLLVKANNKNDH